MIKRFWKDGVLQRLEINGLEQEITDEIRGLHKIPDALLNPRPIPKPKPKPKPNRAEWPLWAKALKQLSKPEDKGVGDVVARMIGEETSAAFAVWYGMTFGRPCGCKGRQARWNTLYPLNTNEDKPT